MYPKGYVEMLEQQQGQLVAGLQDMYRRLVAAKLWPGPLLAEENGHPLTHDLLAALDLLESKQDGSGEVEMFEEDCEKLQSRLFKAGAPSMRRKASSSSESSQRNNSIPTPMMTPDTTKAAVFRGEFSFSPSQSPLSQSPAPHQQQQRRSVPAPPAQSPLHHSTPLSNDPQFFQAEWSLSQNPESLIRSRFAMQTPSMQQPNYNDDLAGMLNQGWMDNSRFDWPDTDFTTFSPVPTMNANFATTAFPDMSTSIDPMDLEFQRFIQVST